MKIEVVTDSTADIPEELTQRYNIHVVPNTIVVAGQSLVDGKSISREEFYQRLPSLEEQPTTATASPGVYQELYEELLGGGAAAVLSVHTSSLLSGIVNAATAAARSFKDQVYVFDSGMVSLAMGFQALAAAEAAERGASLENLLALLANVRQRSRLTAMLDTLEYVRRSGRVSWARARLGNLLQIKPFVELQDGIVHSLGEVRTTRKGRLRLKEIIHNLGPLERLALLHTNAENEARQLLADLNIQLPNPPLVVNVTTVIGTHVGPNGLGFAAVVE